MVPHTQCAPRRHHSFLIMWAWKPEHLDRLTGSEREFKRVDHRAIDYLQADELRVILDGMIGPHQWTKRWGSVDVHVHTGARCRGRRARAADLGWQRPSVRLFGKGVKSASARSAGPSNC